MAKKTIILLGFVLLKFILQYVLISLAYDLHRDEYLHLDQANHLAWGYLSVPPVTSWIAFVIKLLGNDVFWVKFFPALFGALTIVVVWKTIVELKGNLFALMLGAAGVLFSVLLRLNLLFQPNSLDVLCWATLYLVVIKYINSESPKWLYVGAVVFAIGFLNKYNIAFLLIGLLPALLLTRYRTLFVSKSFYLAVLAGLLLVLPNLVWQYLHGFPVIHHMQALSETQLVHVDRWGFGRSQLLFYIGSLFVIVAGLYALLVYRPFQKYRLFFWAFCFTLLVFIYLRAKDYYAIGLYPIYIAFGAVFLGDLLKSGWKRFLQPVAVLLPVLLFIPMYNFVFLNKSPAYILQNQQKYQALGLLRWEDGKDHPLPQDNADMLGWQELARKVDKVYAGLPDPGKTLVLCDNYGQAGAINYYTRNGIRAVSFNADYIDWFDLDKPYSNLIRVKELEERESELAETSPYFQNSSMADSITNPFAREHGTTIFSFAGAKVDINARLKKEVAEVKLAVE
ncbi:hypothetical protein GCM10023188_37950 [Pontibacter saemangeumensis]|uniref:Glycosyltransferase RgtA/B/C/D-like domain-containing protein n=1 Tax=Pontibacter saemangeumensis TaxID=1084525 RepID=A0ABP8LYP9_9BACT